MFKKNSKHQTRRANSACATGKNLHPPGNIIHIQKNGGFIHTTGSPGTPTVQPSLQYRILSIVCQQLVQLGNLVNPTTTTVRHLFTGKIQYKTRLKTLSFSNKGSFNGTLPPLSELLVDRSFAKGTNKSFRYSRNDSMFQTLPSNQIARLQLFHRKELM